MQAIFKVLYSNVFSTLQKIDFKKILLLDVPKDVKLPKQTKSFRKFCPLAHLVNIFQL